MKTDGTSHLLKAAIVLTTAATSLAGALGATGPGAAHAAGRRSAAPAILQDVGNATSTNWSGYSASGGTYKTVSANWTEPSVTSCSTDGTVVFWVGLDGWGSSTVEQSGTGVDCSSGTPRHFAWWETYPANSIQRYSDQVSAGDRLTASVTAGSDGLYDLVLTDATRGWTETKRVPAPGARDASAEIVVEAVSSDGAVTPLPDFGAVDFTDARIDAATPQAAGAQPVDMTDAAGDPIAVTEPADAQGDFDIDYTTPSRAAAGSRIGRAMPLTGIRH